MNPPPKKFKLQKINKRMHVVLIETGGTVYSPPDFVHTHSREPLQLLVDHFNRIRRKDIMAIAEFEDAWTIGHRR